jgi:hypothetical protein
MNPLQRYWLMLSDEGRFQIFYFLMQKPDAKKYIENMIDEFETMFPAFNIIKEDVNMENENGIQ